ncbi:MAG: PQQ-dependent sugar dehydrogenase [bacterium]
MITKAFTIASLLLFIIQANLQSQNIGPQETGYNPDQSAGQYTIEKAFPNLQNFSETTELTNSGDGTNRMFLSQQDGKIYVFQNNPSTGIKKVFLDLSNKIYHSPSAGLLGITFHPNYNINKYFFVRYIYMNSYNHLTTRISRFTVSSNPDSGLFNSELIILNDSVPYPGHMGGKLAFGPDGYLYASFGDGGTGAPGGHLAQNRSSLWGKVLRLNVDSASQGRNYSIPPTNPFYNNTQGFKEEIYAYGFRNNWKFCFDFPTNRLWLADVGEQLWEEIDLIENGKNYGWNKMEGFHCYSSPPPYICDTAGRGFTRPIWEYQHDTGGTNNSGSITGGYVYRGNAHPELYGQYIYGDFVTGKVWALNYNGTNVTSNIKLLDTNINIVTFGVDESKEFYFCNYDPGVIYKIKKTTGPSLNLFLKVFLQGFYNANTDSMSMRDTLKVNLRNSYYPYAIADSSSGFLSKQGTFTGVFNNAQNGVPYYIVVKHRNSIETWSATGQTFTKDILNYDFTTSSSQAFGNNLKLKGSRYCIYSGDVNQDGFVDLSDLTPIDNNSYNFILGYFRTDLNGDNFTDLSDYALAINNDLNFVSVIRP